MREFREAGGEPHSLPQDSPVIARNFLGTLNPQAMIWVGGTLKPNIVRAIGNHGLPAMLINARGAVLLPRGTGLLPRAVRSVVAPFERIMAVDGATATRLLRAGVNRETVTATGPILPEPTPMPHNQYELTVMAEALGTRPIWLGACIGASEVKDVAVAHLAASRKSHRLMLLFSPLDPEDGPKVAETLREFGLRVCVRSQGDEPDAEAQVYVVDLPGELGLWCRIAPLTYLGGTLRAESHLSPYDPIALGSAIVHGTRKAPYLTEFSRIAQAEASREVRSAAELGIAVGSLIAPERAAQMALAGWEEVTRSSESVNAIVRRCVDILETAQ